MALKPLIKTELVFQSAFLYSLSLVYVFGGRFVPAWTGNGSDWGPASTLELHSLSDRYFDQCGRIQENHLLSVCYHNSSFFEEILFYSKDAQGLHPPGVTGTSESQCTILLQIYLQGAMICLRETSPESPAELV